MAYTKRQIVTVLSILFLVALTAVAAYSLYSIRYYSLPISTILGALTVALPPIAGLSIESAIEFRRHPVTAFSSKRRHKRNTNVTVTIFVLLILETAIATLSGTYLVPASSLTCPLDEQWSRMYSSKNENGIKRIQNAFNCCGLHSIKDMPSPLPSKHVPVDTCAKRFDRKESCFAGWRAEEQKAAGMMLLVAVLVFIWKVLIVTDPLERPSWLRRVLRVPAQDNEADREESARRAIEYPEAHERYVDEAPAEADDLVGAVPTLSTPETRNPTLSPTLSSRVQPSGLRGDE